MQGAVSTSKPASQEDIARVVDGIKASLHRLSSPVHPGCSVLCQGHRSISPPVGSTSRSVARNPRKRVFHLAQNRQPKHPFHLRPPTELTDKCNTLRDYFKAPCNGGINMPTPLRSTSRLPNGNMVLSFKTKEDAIRARVHAEEWIKLIDSGATAPQHRYAVVTQHPGSPVDRPCQLREAINEVEASNSDVAPLDFTVTDLAWLNSPQAREKSGRGSLMLSLKSKTAADAVIDHNLAIRGVTCSVSVYIPRPPHVTGARTGGTERRSTLGRSAAVAARDPTPLRNPHAYMTTPAPLTRGASKSPPSV